MPTTKAPQPRLSIIIPAPGDEATLEETLVSVLENRPENSEIVVVLGFGYHDPWSVGEEVRFIQAPIGSNRVACINLGLAASTGRIIHILATGWRATPFWTDEAVEHFNNEQVAAVVSLEVASDDTDRIVATGIEVGRGGRRVMLRPRGDTSRVQGFHKKDYPSPSGPTLEAGFWSRQMIDRLLFGFCPACGDEYADADMAISLHATGGRVVFEPTSKIIAAPERHHPQPAFKAGLYGERLFWRSFAAEPIPQSLVLHIVEILRHAIVRAPLGTLPVLVGRFVALLQFGMYIPRFRELSGLMRSQATGTAQRSNEVSSNSSRILRYDEGHARTGRPHRRRKIPLKRSA